MKPSVGDGQNTPISFFKFLLNWTLLNCLLLDIDNISLYYGQSLVNAKYITGNWNFYILYQSFNSKLCSCYHV